MANKKAAKKKAAAAPKATLESYMERIGAEQRNFRRWVVREEARDGYHRDKFSVTFTTKGLVKINEARGAKIPTTSPLWPTADEAAAISLAVQSAKWPKSIAASRPQFEQLRKTLEKKHGGPVLLYPYWNETGDEILFVQHRVYTESKLDKNDYPWSLWSDGAKWRQMEPDKGELPLYNQHHLKNAWQVFLHEGAATADYVSKFVNGEREPNLKQARVDCPWLWDLSLNAAHLGWPGGAPNPHRVDWTPLQRLSPNVSVTLVCDHDHGGENAARYISAVLKRRLRVIRFGNQFPPKFDLANAFPAELYKTHNGARIYNGPELDDCAESATWATRSPDTLRDEFVEDWTFTDRPAVFIHRLQPHRRYSADEFNAHVAAFSDVKNVADLLRTYPSARASTIVYDPSQPSGRITEERAQVVNIYQPSFITASSGDVKPWLEFLEYLIPDPGDRHELMKWDATLIARPDIRMTYSVLLISDEQGVGKTTHADILAKLVGNHNCSYPTAEEATDIKFTTWRLFKRLAVIAEIYAGHSAKAYNQLKQAISDDKARAEEKYERPYTIKNWIHVHASSNSFKALKVDDNDRRWLIPGVTQEIRSGEYWRELYRWIETPGSLSAIAYWAQKFVEQHGTIRKGDNAPASAAKRKTIEEGRTDGERLIFDLAEALMNFGKVNPEDEPKNALVMRDEIQPWLKRRKALIDTGRYGNDGGRFLEGRERIAALFKKVGCERPDREFKKMGRKTKVFANFKADFDAMSWEEMLALRVAPEDLLPEAF